MENNESMSDHRFIVFEISQTVARPSGIRKAGWQVSRLDKGRVRDALRDAEDSDIAASEFSIKLKTNL